MYLACQPFSRSPSRTKQYGPSVVQRPGRVARSVPARLDTMRACTDEDAASKVVIWRGKDRDGRDVEVTRGYFGLANRLQVWELSPDPDRRSLEWHIVGDNMSELPALRIPRN